MMQSACRQPDPNAIVHQDLEPVGSSVGKHIGMVRLGCTEDGDYAGQRRVGSGAHIQWLYCQPGAVDSNHLRSDADQQANSLAAEMGQVTAITKPPLRTSTGTAEFVRCGNAMNDGTCRAVMSTAVASAPPLIGGLDLDDSLSQRCNILAFIQLALATAAMDAPSAQQAAINSALVSAEYVRLVLRAAYLGVSESLSIASTII
nr:hypothetical protein [Curvibacter sp. AEP1-3]